MMKTGITRTVNGSLASRNGLGDLGVLARGNLDSVRCYKNLNMRKQREQRTVSPHYQ